MYMYRRCVVFWGDAQTDKIGMTNVENQTTTVIVSIPSTHIFGMDLYKNNLYVTDWGAAGNLGLTSAIHRIANNGTSAATIGRVLGHLADIVVANGCTVNNGGCTDICIPLPGDSKKCITPDPSVPAPGRRRRRSPENINEVITTRRVARSVSEGEENGGVVKYSGEVDLGILSPTD
ncbi:hypothetical protein C0Q70_04206 [Pomacea canaliculata]|uniref:Uncharacterized protein n=1 Tax=Pomacea canaliculata TaxID=400727 RepID=A0A2T7PUW7_POMCA|nr:hypothetical protein C0Q70_04206 [Pomacea canaliculata]